MGVDVYVEDLDIPPSKIGETALRVIDRAFDDAHRRRHPLVANEHLFLALAQIEWDTFAALMRDIDVNPRTVLQATEEHIRLLAPGETRDLVLEPAAKLVLKVALHHANRAGRQAIEAVDLFSAVLEDRHGTHASILRRYGV